MPPGSEIDFGQLGLRLLIDVAAILVLALGLSYRRHRRRDLVALYTIFNIGLFAAVVVIAEGEVAASVGFGLFAVLSIIRLRSESLSNAEIAYFFAAIVLGLITAVELGDLRLTVGLVALLLVVSACVDQSGLLRATRPLEVMFDEALTDVAELRRRLEQRLGAEVVELDIREVDYVRETTRLAVRLSDPGDVPAHDEGLRARDA